MSITLLAVIIVAAALAVLTEWGLARLGSGAEMARWASLVVLLVVFVLVPTSIG